MEIRVNFKPATRNGFRRIKASWTDCALKLIRSVALADDAFRLAPLIKPHGYLSTHASPSRPPSTLLWPEACCSLELGFPRCFDSTRWQHQSGVPLCRAALIATLGCGYACVGRFWQAVLIDAGPVGVKGEDCRNGRRNAVVLGVNSLISTVRSALCWRRQSLTRTGAAGNLAARCKM
jgi:hypothetical protein